MHRVRPWETDERKSIFGVGFGVVPLLFFDVVIQALVMIGETISHYLVVDKLGEGVMGVVYKAEDTRLGRFVALMLLVENFASDPHVCDRFPPRPAPRRR